MYLGAFRYRSGIYPNSFVQKLLSILTPLVDNDRPRSDFTVPQISGSVVIPERTWIFPACYTFYQKKRLPGTFSFSRGTHEQSFIRSTDINPELIIVKTYRRCPGASAIF